MIGQHSSTTDLRSDSIKSGQLFDYALPVEPGEKGRIYSYQFLAILQQMGWKDCP